MPVADRHTNQATDRGWEWAALRAVRARPWGRSVACRRYAAPRSVTPLNFKSSGAGRKNLNAANPAGTHNSLRALQYRPSAAENNRDSKSATRSRRTRFSWKSHRVIEGSRMPICRLHNSAQRLVQIADKVFGSFNANRKPDHIITCTRRIALLCGQLAMGC